MEICVKCRERPRVGPTQAYCQPCLTEYLREWRKKNPGYYAKVNRRSYLKHHEERLEGAAEYRQQNGDKIRAHAADSRKAKREVIDRIKSEGSCADCGGQFAPVAMDFDHVRGEKLFNIAHVGGSARSLEALMTEIDKCDLVCANCHRVRTQMRGQGWFAGNPRRVALSSG